MKHAEWLLPMADDIGLLLSDIKNESILFEGAQGALLDIDCGTYPYVTSSNTTAGAAATGSGYGPLQFDGVLGMAKAYTTRVGSGPFPTELSDDVGAALARTGHEFGATTGRPRRCGWLDLVALNYVVRVNSLSHLALMKLDVLDVVDEIKVCVAYEYRGEHLSQMPQDTMILEECTPVYQSFKAWSQPVTGIREIEALPIEARSYIDFIAEQTGVPIAIVSTGADRADTIFMQSDLF